jgi:hypothetical protein
MLDVALFAPRCKLAPTRVLIKLAFEAEAYVVVAQCKKMVIWKKDDEKTGSVP